MAITRVLKRWRQSMLVWIVVVACLAGKAQTHIQDSLVLVTLYNTLDGPNWTDNSGWLTGPVDNWFGIAVQDGRVTEIELYFNNLTGELPGQLGQLSELRTLSLYLNQITGEIPAELGDLEQLEDLILSRNAISGTVPQSLTQLTSLHQLVLLDNDLTGPLPDLSPLQNIEELVLDNNDFPGPFPEWILDMPNLRFLGLGRTGLTGELPEELLSSLPVLDHLRVPRNDLEGDIAKWFKGISPMTTLDIYDNRFSGQIPDGVVDPEIADFVIGFNDISGIPDFSSVSMPKSYFIINDNRLGFHELEKALQVETFIEGNLSLGPQKELLSPEVLVVKPGEPVLIEAGSFSDMDQYQWFHDGIAIPGATAEQFVINSYEDQDAGVYHSEITNPAFSFSLQRSPVTLQTELPSSSKYSGSSSIVVYPNPATTFITIEYDGVHSVEVIDINGRSTSFHNGPTLYLTSLTQGVYLIRVKTDNGVFTGRFLKQ